MNEQTKELINAVGALGELSGAMRESLLLNGFTRKEACDIIGTMIAQALFSNKKGE